MRTGFTIALLNTKRRCNKIQASYWWSKSVDLNRKAKWLLSLIFISVIVVSTLIGAIYIHDCPSNTTAIADITSGLIPNDTEVIVKGEISSILVLAMGPNDQIVTITDGEGNLTFYWTQFRLDVGWVITVKGYVKSSISRYDLYNVSYVERVWMFSGCF